MFTFNKSKMKLKNYILNILQKHGFTVILTHKGFEDNLQLSNSYAEEWLKEYKEGNDFLKVIVVAKGYEKFCIVVSNSTAEKYPDVDKDSHYFEILNTVTNVWVNRKLTNITDAVNFLIEHY